MRSFRAGRRGTNAQLIVELSFKDMLSMLIGKEVVVYDPILSEDVVIRQSNAYELFNLLAPKQ